MTTSRFHIVQTHHIFTFAAIIICVQSFVRIDLSGDGWTVANNTGIQVPGRVPGSMYTALVDKGYLQDPLYGDNDVKYAFIAYSNWSYFRTFSVPDSVASATQVWLICEGLDTIATVSVNGKTVGKSDNMFVRSAFNLTGIVKKDDNQVLVKFSSAVKEALARVNNSAYVVPPECPPQVQNGQCHVNQIRKEQCSFSWDWGPSFPTQGIWKPIYIDAYNNAVIREISAVVKKVNPQWEVIIDIFFDLGNEVEVKGQLKSAIYDLNVTYSEEIVLSPAKDRFQLILPIPTTTNVSLWWPNGYGSQKLFNLSVSFTSGPDISEKSIRIGFRTVELVQQPVTNKAEDGLSFYFRVNGVPIFLKGSNWIPTDSFQERITPEKVQFLLESAADVHINSLRVWGGGVYESEWFYQLCDELGILLWQDMMFSVAMYPVYKEFLDSVATEVTQQVRRLKHHPSILVWAGNNENELGLRQNWFNTSGNYTLYYNNYVQLYVKVIKTIVQAEDPTREYLTSSPSDGLESEKEDYVAKNPASESYGDIHYYNYIVDQWNAKSFQIPRMASEYGIQAWCNNESLANVFDPSDFSMDSSMVEHRQHHDGGNLEMLLEVGLHMNLPNSSDARTKFADFIYLTQVNQAMSIRTQTEHYRRYQSQLLPDGRGLTMGALYWQLNDIWQAPTWSSIDYEGRWKMLHYFARSFFSNYLVSPYLRSDNTLDVFIIIDEIPVKDVRLADGKLTFQPILYKADVKKHQISQRGNKEPKWVHKTNSGNFNLSIYDYNSFKALFIWSIPYHIQTAAESVFTITINDLLKKSGCAGVENCLIYLTATDDNGSVLSTSWLPLAYPKFSKLLPANVKIISVTKLKNNNFSIQVSTDAIALFVWLSAGNITGTFSDNGFLMLTPGTNVHFRTFEATTVSQLTSQLKVRSITNVRS